MIVELLPRAAGGLAQHTRSTGTSNWSNVDDPTPDDDATYNFLSNLSATPITATDAVSIQTAATVLGGTPVGTINSLTIRLRARRAFLVGGGAADLAPAVRVGGTVYAPSMAAAPVSYADVDYVLTTNPATGVAWTWTNVGAIQAAYQSSVAGDGVSASEVRHTRVAALVDYNPAYAAESVSLTVGAGADPEYTWSSSLASLDVLDLYVERYFSAELDAIRPPARELVSSGRRILDLDAER